MIPKREPREPEPLDVLPPEQAMRRTDDLLRAMLNSPPSPHVPKTKKKPAKRAKKA